MVGGGGCLTSCNIHAGYIAAQYWINDPSQQLSLVHGGTAQFLSLPLTYLACGGEGEGEVVLLRMKSQFIPPKGT